MYKMEVNGVSNLVIGLGEIGKAIQAVLSCDGIDKNDTAPKMKYDIIHICIPWSDAFVDVVIGYQEQFNPEVTVIHSTVPIGTSDALGAVHSPVRGVHPNLEQGVRQFVKFFGGKDALIPAQVFLERGVKVQTTGDARNTEAGKIWSTTQYGAQILLQKEIYEFCEKHGLDFDVVYTKFNRTYNQGYDELGLTQFCRPVLKNYPGPIGGHCVVPNCHLINSETPTKIIKADEKLRKA